MNKTYYNITTFVKIIMIIVLSLLSFFIVEKFSHIAFYSLLQGDDIVQPIQCIDNLPYQYDGNLLKAGIVFASQRYMGWNGNFLSNVLAIVLGMLDKSNFTLFNQWVMYINAIVYFVSFLVFIYTVVHYVCENAQIEDKMLATLVIFFTILVSIHVFNLYPECFTWFSASVSYTFPLSLFFIAFSLMIINDSFANVFLFIMMFPLSILSMLGSLEICGFAGTMCFAFMIYYLFSKQKKNVFTIIILFAFIIGIAINGLAPGNVMRMKIESNEYMKTEYSMNIEAIYNYVFEAISLRLQNFLENIVAVRLSLISGLSVGTFLYSYKKYRLTIPALFSIIIFILSPIMTMIPVGICYSNFDYFYFPDRVYLMIDISIVISFFILCVFISYLVSRLIHICNQKHNISWNQLAWAPIFIIIVISISTIGNNKFSETISNASIHEVTKNISKGNYQTSFDKYLKLIGELDAQRYKKVSYISKTDLPDDLPGIINGWQSFVNFSRFYDNERIVFR